MYKCVIHLLQKHNIYSCISMFIGGQQQTEQAILSLLKYQMVPLQCDLRNRKSEHAQINFLFLEFWGVF